MSVILVSAGYDHTIRFWEALTGVCSRTIQHTESQVNSLEITNDKRYLAACGSRKVNLYDISSTNPSPVSSFEGHSGNVTNVGFQREGRWVCTSSEDGTVRVWDTRARAVQRTYTSALSGSPSGTPINSVVVHPNQGELISCDGDGVVAVWDLAENKCAARAQTAAPGADTRPLQSVTCAADGSIVVAAGATGDCYVWSIGQNGGSAGSGGGSAASLHAYGAFRAHATHVTRVLLSGDCRHLATCSADHTARVWAVPPLEGEGAQRGERGGCQVSDEGTVWRRLDGDATTAGSMGSMGFAEETTLRAHQRWVWDCAFSADSAYLVTAGSDHYVRLWDLSTNETVRQYNGHSKGVVCVALNDV